MIEPGEVEVEMEEPITKEKAAHSFRERKTERKEREKIKGKPEGKRKK